MFGRGIKSKTPIPLTIIPLTISSRKSLIFPPPFYSAFVIPVFARGNQDHLPVHDAPVLVLALPKTAGTGYTGVT
jgi:hypothetical protein